jgi:class 3 adenylate cyclase
VTDAPRTRYARSSDGTSLAYQISGEGPLELVWLPSMGLPIELSWDDPGLIRVHKRLTAFSRTVWFEGRGFGASEGDPLDSLVGEISDADLTALLDTIGSESVALVGPGHGGSAAIHFSVTHAERVKALVLINAYAHYVRHADYPWGFPPHVMERLTQNLRERWATGGVLEFVAPSRLADNRFRQWWARSEQFGVGPDQMTELTRANCERDLRPLLASVRAPTLVLHRQADRYIRVGAGRYLAEHIPGARFVALPGEDHLFFVGDVDALLDEIEEFLTGRHQAPEGDLVLATVLFTDIVNSTHQAARLGHRAWSKLTDEHDALVRAALKRHRGHEVKTMGDGFLATFDGGARAVRCAREIATEARALGLEVRAGLHTGEIEVRGNDLAGLAVIIAKRICDLAGSGQVLVSDTVRGLLVGSGIPLSDSGTHVLKGVPDEWRLFAVPGLPPAP